MNAAAESDDTVLILAYRIVATAQIQSEISDLKVWSSLKSGTQSLHTEALLSLCPLPLFPSPITYPRSCIFLGSRSGFF